MSLTRIGPEGLEKRRGELKRLKDEIRAHEEVSNQKDSPLWARLGPAIKKSIEANRDKMEQILEAQSVSVQEEFANAKALAAAIRSYKNILQEVEVDAVIARKRDRVAALTEEINTIIKEQGEAQS